MAAFDSFRDAARSLPPQVAVVLGSGLGPVVTRVTVVAEAGFADIPGFAAPTVHGHGGRAILGRWAGVPVLVFQGRMHFYEGHPWERATAAVRLAADLGVRTLVLTNAAGGIRDDLTPGDLMPIRDHLKLLDREAWRHSSRHAPCAVSLPPQHLGASSPSPAGDGTRSVPTTIYSPRLLALLPPNAGTYAALTGPTYETPAEIRALRTMGADAVGMSTAVEAETAAALGLEVAAISCVTNKAAGLAAGELAHTEVAQVAGRADVVGRMANLLERLIVEGGPRSS